MKTYSAPISEISKWDPRVSTFWVLGKQGCGVGCNIIVHSGSHLTTASFTVDWSNTLNVSFHGCENGQAKVLFYYEEGTAQLARVRKYVRQFLSAMGLVVPDILTIPNLGYLYFDFKPNAIGAKQLLSRKLKPGF